MWIYTWLWKSYIWNFIQINRKKIRTYYMVQNSTKYYLDLSQWSIGTTQKPNEITLVSCNKSNFNMYILNNNRVPMSLLNLSLLSLYQNKLNSALNLTKYVIPKNIKSTSTSVLLISSPSIWFVNRKAYDCILYFFTYFWLVNSCKIDMLNILITTCLILGKVQVIL